MSVAGKSGESVVTSMPLTQSFGIQSSLPLPPRLELSENVAESWKRWRQRWDSFEIASRLIDQENKYRIATFVTCIGDEAIEIYNGLSFEQEEDKQSMSKVLELMERYCVGQTNVIYERYCFNNRNQETGELFDSYLTAVKALAKTCNFGVLTDELIRDRIVCGVRDVGTRKRLLQEAQLTLLRCLDVCRSAETTASQVKVMGGREDIHAFKHKQGDRRARRTTMPVVDCNYCGRKHEKSRDKCLAFGKMCNKCGKENHFAAVCKQKLGEFSGKKRESINRIKETEDLQSSSDDEYCFMVSSENSEESVKKVNAKQPYKAKILATMKIEGRPIRFQVDSGATCNVIGRGDVPKNCRIIKSKQVLNMFNGTQMRSGGKCLIKLVNPKNGSEYTTEFVVIEDDCTPLLGSKSVQQMNLIEIRYENIAVVRENGNEEIQMGLTMQEISENYEDVFTGQGEFQKELHLEVDETVSPVRQPVRRIPVAMKPKLKEELIRLEKLAVIKPVDTPTDWVSSLVLVKKPSGKLRVCIDPKPLNKALKRSHYLLPVIDDLLPDLSQAKIFSVCDVKDGFWHVRLDEESSYLTTFGTPFGRYRWLKMPFGISPAPEYFQHRLDQAIEGLPGVRTVADDILISGEGNTMKEAVQDHDRKLVALLDRCRKKGLKLNKAKLKLKMTEIPYVGHLLTQDGLKPDPSKVEAIRKMTRPIDVKGIQRLIGLVNYLTRFLGNLADICEPLRQLTRKDADWQWSDSHEEAFIKIKEAITKAPVLRYFDPLVETTLQCDASDTGLGATLMQLGQPVAYASRSLTNAERNYAQIEKELLAIVFGAEKFNQYTYGRRVIVESDHKPLESIYKKPLVAAPKRLQRMLLRLQKYDLEIHFKSGKQMYLADTLSRAALVNNESNLEVLTIEKELEEIHMVDFLPVRKARLQEIRDESRKDDAIQALEKVIRSGWPENKKDLSRDVTPYYHVRDQLSVQEGIIFHGNRCVVPSSLRANVLSRIHRSHIGLEGCLRRARESVYWPGMNTAVKEWVSRCETCRTCEISQQKEILWSHEVSTNPWSKVAADLLEINNKHYLVTVDYYSNYWEVEQMESNTKSRAVINKLRQQFARHGIPDTLVSDNGPQFASSEFEKFADTWEFKHVTSSPGYAQSNGMVESAVKTVKRLIRKAEMAGTDPWLAILDYRNTPTEGMTSSPVQRLMSRRTRTLLPSNKKLLKPKVAVGVNEERKEKKSKQAFYYNKNARDLPPLKKGDIVRIQPLQNRKRLWQKASVQGEVNVRSYEVLTEDGATFRRNRRHLRATREVPGDHVMQVPSQTQSDNVIQVPSQTQGGGKEAEQENLDGEQLENNLSESEGALVAPEHRTVSTIPTAVPGETRTRYGRISRPPTYLKDYTS